MLRPYIAVKPLGIPGKAPRSARSQETSSFAPPVGSLAGGMVLRRLLLVVFFVGACGQATHRPDRPSAHRIVSLLPTFTEILFDIGAGDRVVGRTTWCDYPPAALAVPSVGDGMPPNIESVAAQKPDLVVLYNSGQNVTAAGQLERIGIRTVLLDMNRLEDLGPATRALGRLTGLEQRAESLASAMDALLHQPPPTSTTSAPGRPCDRRDSNPHGSPHQLLRLARLPIPPRSRKPEEIYTSWGLMVSTNDSGVLRVP